MIGHSSPEPHIRVVDLDVRPRLGFLLPVPEDRWWPQLADAEAQAAQLGAVVGQIQTLALPWFAANDTAATAARFNTGKRPVRQRG